MRSEGMPSAPTEATAMPLGSLISDSLASSNQVPNKAKGSLGVVSRIIALRSSPQVRCAAGTPQGRGGPAGDATPN